ncbi:hypothetical protein [Nostoc sp.]
MGRRSRTSVGTWNAQATDIGYNFYGEDRRHWQRIRRDSLGPWRM